MINIDFSNKNILITGGASGAGRGIVRQFAKTGGRIIFSYNHSRQEADSLLEELKDCDLHAYHLDQSDLSSIDDTVEQIVEDNGKLDVLVNNAGIYPAKKMNDISEEDWDQMLDTNTKGIFFLSRKASQNMNENSAIINISSINATNPSVTLIHYGTSKAAVEMLTRCMAYELGPKIRVNCIAPGLIYKKGQEAWIPGWTESYCERAALKKLVHAEDIGNAAIFLASDLSGAITGQTITVDCGIELAPCFDNTH